MARLCEHQVKDLLRLAGVPVPKGQVAKSASQVKGIAHQLGYPVVVKALLPTGKRQKAGLVAFCDGPEEIKQVADKILGTVIGQYKVKEVLVEEKLQIEKEFYISFNIDCRLGKTVVLFIGKGGINVEEFIESNPDAIHIKQIDPLKGLRIHEAVELFPPSNSV